MPGRLTSVGQALLDTATPQRPTLGSLAASVAIMLAIAALDYVVGFEIHLTAVYLIPIFLAAWNVGRGAGIALAVASSALSVGGDALAGEPYSSALVPWTMLLLWVALFTVFVLVLTQLKRALEREQGLARIDALTTVANRRHFVELAAAELSRAKRHGRPMTVAYLDLDNFKQVNDQLGHEMGDELLRTVATAMRNRLRVTDSVGRMGGDEFAICLPETGMQAGSKVLGELRRQVLEALPEACRMATLSVGAVTFTVPPMSVEVLLRRADQVLYAAKRDGKNQLKIEAA
jgi:diguanylate cyclase (GGDEF)-like protein